jgi:hypothetical protein
MRRSFSLFCSLFFLAFVPQAITTCSIIEKYKKFEYFAENIEIVPVFPSYLPQIPHFGTLVLHILVSYLNLHEEGHLETAAQLFKHHHHLFTEEKSEQDKLFKKFYTFYIDAVCERLETSFIFRDALYRPCQLASALYVSYKFDPKNLFFMTEEFLFELRLLTTFPKLRQAVHDELHAVKPLEDWNEDDRIIAAYFLHYEMFIEPLLRKSESKPKLTSPNFSNEGGGTSMSLFCRYFLLVRPDEKYNSTIINMAYDMSACLARFNMASYFVFYIDPFLAAFEEARHPEHQSLSIWEPHTFSDENTFLEFKHRVCDLFLEKAKTFHDLHLSTYRLPYDVPLVIRFGFPDYFFLYNHVKDAPIKKNSGSSHLPETDVYPICIDLTLRIQLAKYFEFFYKLPLLRKFRGFDISPDDVTTMLGFVKLFRTDFDRILIPYMLKDDLVVMLKLHKFPQSFQQLYELPIISTMFDFLKLWHEAYPRYSRLRSLEIFTKFCMHFRQLTFEPNKVNFVAFLQYRFATIYQDKKRVITRNLSHLKNNPGKFGDFLADYEKYEGLETAKPCLSVRCYDNFCHRSKLLTHDFDKFVNVLESTSLTANGLAFQSVILTVYSQRPTN